MKSSKNPWLGLLLHCLPVAWLLGATAPSVRAAVVSSFGVAKYRAYSQTSTTLPASPFEFGFYAFAYQSAEDSVDGGFVTGPGGALLFLSNDSNDTRLLLSEDTFTSQSQMESARANGTYSYQLFGSAGNSVNASVSLTGDLYPTPTAVSNFTAAQDVDRTQAFTLQWTKPAQLDATDFVALTIYVDGEEIFKTPGPWLPGVLAGTVTSVTLPANLLPATGEIEGWIDFMNISARETQSLPGATGMAGYLSSTRFPIKVHGGGSGGDTTAPRLVSSQPTMGATGVSRTAPVVLTFSEAMKPQQQITWFGPANPATFVYAWSADGRTLTCTYPGGFAANASVFWQLDSSAFSDLAGNTLAEQAFGTFVTGSGGTTNPCENGFDKRANSFFIARTAYFSQTNSAAPVPWIPTADNPVVAGFFASFSATNIPITLAEVVIPGGQRKTLSSQFGTYFTFQTFPTEAGLLAAYPNGSYTGELTVSGGAKSSSTVTLGNGPNTPHCSNFTAAQVINPAAAFVLSWYAFSAPGPNDRIEITITDDQGVIVLRLPDECAQPPKPLAVTATSVTLPANLLLAAKTYTVDLTFIRVSDLKTTGSPAYSTIGGFTRTTKFNIKTIGGTPNVTPGITGYRIAADGRFEMDVTGSVGRTIKLEASNLATTWTTVGSAIVPASGKVTVRDSRLANLLSQSYRARSE